MLPIAFMKTSTLYVLRHIHDYIYIIWGGKHSWGVTHYMPKLTFIILP